MGQKVPIVGHNEPANLSLGTVAVKQSLGDVTWDFLVVGAGIGGSAAAARAAELGLRTLLLDKGPDPSTSGNTRLSGGSLHIGEMNLRTEPAVLLRRINDLTENTSHPSLAGALVNNAARSLEWLSSQGVEFESSVDPAEEWRTLLAPRRSFEHVSMWKGAGPHQALQRLQSRVLEFSGAVAGGTPVRSLIKDRDRITGVLTDGGGRIAAHAVLLADGGFQANPKLRRKYIGPAADRLFLRGASPATGDGLTMGIDVGAATVKMQWFYGHLLHRDAIHNDRLWPMPLLDDLLECGILVDSKGSRFTDESLGGIAAANSIARRSDPVDTYIILDEPFWASSYREPDAGWNLPANPELARRGAVIHRGASVEALATSASIAGEVLEATLRTYNAAGTDGNAGQLQIPRSANTHPIRSPLLAIPIVPGITMTMGGLLIDDHARVLDSAEGPIPGLYAAGGTAGGLQGGRLGGYVGGLAPALIFGLLAAEHVARQLRSS